MMPTRVTVIDAGPQAGVWVSNPMGSLALAGPPSQPPSLCLYGPGRTAPGLGLFLGTDGVPRFQRLGPGGGIEGYRQLEVAPGPGEALLEAARALTPAQRSELRALLDREEA